MSSSQNDEPHQCPGPVRRIKKELDSPDVVQDDIKQNPPQEQLYRLARPGVLESFIDRHQKKSGPCNSTNALDPEIVAQSQGLVGFITHHVHAGMAPDKGSWTDCWSDESIDCVSDRPPRMAEHNKIQIKVDEPMYF